MSTKFYSRATSVSLMLVASLICKDHPTIGVIAAYLSGLAWNLHP